MATMQVLGRRYPVVLPSIRDARLHTAAVIITIHTLGITVLGFRVSVPQILAAIITSALIEVAWTLRRTGAIVWPASGMLTGSGVALILRITDMPRSDPWSLRGWYLYAGVAGASVATKYLIRRHGSHVFNPSNIGLVVAFLLLGSTVVEPLDFWWAPLDGWMIAAYAVIATGGALITARLRLLEMTAVFWVTLAAGLGVLSASGHCMTTAWSLAPVCGARFWWVVVSSPEVLIFIFFMITDPKTIPSGRDGRRVYALCLGLLCTLLIAPQSVEFGAKVALLGGLVIMSPSRTTFDRINGLRLVDSWVDKRAVFQRGALVGAGLMSMAFAVIASGIPAREPIAAAMPGSGFSIEVDPDTVPTPTVSEDVSALATAIGDPRELVASVAEGLAIEAEAIRTGDAGLLADADAGARLIEMQERVGDAIATGDRTTDHFRFETAALDIAETGGAQTGAAIMLSVTGTIDEVTYDAFGEEQASTGAPFTGTFMVRQIGGDRWLIVEADH